MAKHCMLTGSRLSFGNHVSHANNKRRRVWRPNLQTKRVYVPSRHADVTLVLSTRAIRTLAKKGVEQVVAEIVARGEPLRFIPRA